MRNHNCTGLSISVFIISFILAALLSHAAPSTVLAADAAALQLVGTIMSDHLTGAVVSDTKGEQSIVKVGEKLPDGSQLMAVNRNAISLKGPDGSQYVVFIHHAIANNGASFQLDASPPAKSVVPETTSAPALEQPEKRPLRRNRLKSDRSPSAEE